MLPHLIRPAARRTPHFMRVAAVACVLALGGCLYGQQRDLTELAQGEAWLALPLSEWLGMQGSGEPEALAACLVPSCLNRIAVGVFRLEGEKASATQADLRNPQRLVRALKLRQDADPDEQAADLDLVPEPFTAGGHQGFYLALVTRGEGRPVLHAAAVGRQDGPDLRVVFAVGDDAEVVRAAVVQLVEEGF